MASCSKFYSTTEILAALFESYDEDCKNIVIMDPFCWKRKFLHSHTEKHRPRDHSLFSFLIYIENGEFHARLFDKRDNFGFDIVRMSCSNVPSKMFYRSIGAQFRKISRATSKTEDLSRNCKQLLSRILKQNG